MSETYRTGIIGTGGIAMAHAIGYSLAEHTDIVAVCDIRPEALGRFFEWAASLEHAKVADLRPQRVRQYADYLEMVEAERLDIVSVATWPDVRAEIVIRLAEQGRVKGIVAEKPFAVTMGEARRMLAACEQAGITVATAHQRRFGPHFQKPKELIASGAIGRVQWIWASGPTRWPDPLYYGTHIMDLLLFYGGPLDWVMGQIGEVLPERWTQGNYPIGYPAVGYMRFKSGALGLFDVEQDKKQLHIMGDAGQILFVEARPQQAVRLLTDAAAGWQPVPLAGETLEWVLQDHGCERYFALLFEDLVACIEQGRQPLDSGRDGAAALEALLAIYESSRRGQRVSLPLTNEGFPLEPTA
jgi:predicted dehydrogenase